MRSLIDEARGILTQACVSILSPHIGTIALDVSPGQGKGRFKAVLLSLGSLVLSSESWVSLLLGRESSKFPFPRNRA